MSKMLRERGGALEFRMEKIKGGKLMIDHEANTFKVISKDENEGKRLEMSELELRNCPFCGFDSPTMRIYKGKDGWRDRYTVICRYDEGGCGAEGGMYHSAAEAAEAWNARYLTEYNVEMKDSWIPCSERLPEHYNEILFCERDRTIHKGYMYWDGTFIENHVKLRKSDIVAWMPMPEPPETEEGGD